MPKSTINAMPKETSATAAVEDDSAKTHTLPKNPNRPFCLKQEPPARLRRYHRVKELLSLVINYQHTLPVQQNHPT